MGGREIKRNRKRKVGERDRARHRERLSKRYHHNMDSCSILLVLFHPDLWWWGSLLWREGTLLYSPVPGISLGTDAIPAIWPGTSILSQFSTVQFFCLDKSYLKFPQFAQWHFIRSVNSKPSPFLGLELMPSCFAICAYLKSLLWWPILWGPCFQTCNCIL